MDNIMTEKYRGLDINIFPDPDPMSPDDWGDDGLFLVGYHDQFTVDRGQRALVTIFKKEEFKEDNGYNGRAYADGYGWKNYKEAKKEGLINKQVRRGRYYPGISQDLARSIANGGKYEDGSINDEAKEYIKKYHIFGLEAYIHSGVRLALSNEGNFPDRQWDVSQLGLVFVSKKEWKDKRTARKTALGHIETWNDYLSGNVYGFSVTAPDGTDLESCWGYSGDYDAEGGALKEARSIVDHLTNKGKTDHTGQHLMACVKE